MSAINFNEVFQSLETGVASIAKTSLQGYYDAAKADGENALESMKANLERWTQEVVSGTLTPDDLGYLLKEEAGLNEMTALKQAGLAEVKLDQFKGSLIGLIINTVTGLFKV
ncbi:hypothetical protein [Mucilaginibacter aquaedulcis]|uniref:hypothetical protein n=1 Tax=Mucilaginibacter aquaedulcis TaxID=1187081 RepID=UPI0025B5433B|nr:hypothetical protein [Mucilaginibacter aquaedulcis]MDN3550029.1 hypothetical protein [Mucilaginibacter aquaedulcis]